LPCCCCCCCCRALKTLIASTHFFSAMREKPRLADEGRAGSPAACRTVKATEGRPAGYQLRLGTLAAIT
jgi:hypothetical protein